MLTTLALLFLPLSAQAMIPLSDIELSSVTGQAGVNINPDIVMNLSMDTLAWGDSDGINPGPYSPSSWGSSTDGGYFGIRDFTVSSLAIQSRSDDTYGGYDAATMWKPFTIDVATGGDHDAGETYVRLGIGAYEISADSIDATFSLAPHSGFTGALNQDLLAVHIGGLEVYINPLSSVDISNSRGTGSSGITFTLDVGIDQWNMGELSFGDRDGLGAGTTNAWIGNGTGAGWVGFSNARISNLLLNGQVDLDVVTVTEGRYADFDGPTTLVRFNFTGCRLELDTLSAAVKLDRTPSLHSTGSTTMCDFFIADASLQVNGWLDIWAH
jgi:hypothetical protein